MSKLNNELERLDLSPEGSALFSIGWHAALNAILSDDTYYNALDASQSAYAAVEESVEYVR